MLVSNPRGSFRFLPGGFPYSCGVVADEGFEVVHVTLRRLLPYQKGFELIEQHLASVGRERTALAAIELRSPAAFSRQGFADFNAGYRELLEAWDLLVEGENPIARTNVAPERFGPTEPSLFGFSYTRAAVTGAGPTFVVSGGGELRAGALNEAQVVRPGETSADAMREKASYVMHVMSKRLEGLGVGWDDVSTTQVYTVQAMDDVLAPVVLEGMGSAVIKGFVWHHSRPPIAELEYEMDVRGVRSELVVG